MVAGVYVYDVYGWQAGYVLFGALGIFLALIIAATSTIVLAMPSSPYKALSPTPDLGDVELIHSQVSNTQISEEFENALLPPPIPHSSFGPGGKTIKPLSLSTMLENFSTAVSTFWRVLSSVLHLWIARPVLILLSLACGIRLGGGYIWAAYTAAFFSELYIPNPQFVKCSFSYSAVDYNLSCSR